MTTTVDYDAKKGRFLIVCPVWDNARVRSMPNKRWDGKNKQWTAPAIRANVEFVQSNYMQCNQTKVSPAAVAAVEGYAEERRKRAKAGAFPAFYGFKREPRPKQMEALNATYGLNSVGLFMDMRTGKTKVAIDWACAARIEGKINKAILICPLTLRKNWIREFAIDATIPIDAHLLTTKDKGKSFDKWLNTPHDFKWLIVGVESLAAGSAHEYVTKFAETGMPVMAIVDESSKIKTHNANRSERVVAIGRKCEYRMIATGTPITKSPLDLYMQFEFLDPDIIGIGDYYSFRARYAVMGGYEGRKVIGYENLDELVNLINPYTFQVRQHEVFESEKVYVLREVELTKEQRALYSDIKRHSRTVGDGVGLTVQNVLEKMLRMQEITGGFISYEHSEEELARMREIYGPSKKLPRTYRMPIDGANPKVAEVLACAEDYDGSTIIWCAFKDEIYAVCKALRAVYGDDQVVELHGDVDEVQRDVNVQLLFQTGKARFIVGNAATGGMGLTMDKADNIFYFSNTFNFNDREQSEERATAKNKTTLIVDIVAGGTVDDTIIAANAEKKDVSEFVRNKIDEVSGNRSNNRASVLNTLLGD